MNRKMNTFNDVFFCSVRSVISYPDFQKGYAMCSQSGWSLRGVGRKQCSPTFLEEEKLYALRRELDWSHRVTPNSERGTPRQERREKLKAVISEERKELERLLG